MTAVKLPSPEEIRTASVEPRDETAKVLRDPELLAALIRSEEDLRAGRTRSAEEVFDDLGW